MTVSEELRRLRFLGVVVLVLLAVIVLAARIVGLLVVVLVDGVERAERVLSSRLGVIPLGGSVTILPPDGVR